MRNRRFFICFSAALVFVTISSEMFAGDWPQWRGSNRDGVVTGFNAPQTWQNQLSQQWRKEVGPGDATPALVDGKLYVFSRQGDNEVLQCMDATTGNLLWKSEYEAESATGAAARHPGPRSSPSVANGKVVTLGIAGVVSCFDAATGRLLWQNKEYSGLYPRFYTSMSPLVVGDVCIFHLGEEKNGNLIAFDLATGRIIWNHAGDGPVYSSPVLLEIQGTRQIVMFTDQNLAGISLENGGLLWQVPTELQTRFYNSSSPVIHNNRVYYTGQGTGTYAIEISRTGDNYSVKELWHNPDVTANYNTPVFRDGYLYGVNNRGRLFCLDASTGRIAWSDDAPHQDFASVVDAGSVMVMLSGATNLVAFRPDGRSYTQLANTKASEAPVYAHPVLSGNKIYVRDGEFIVMYTVD